MVLKINYGKYICVVLICLIVLYICVVNRGSIEGYGNKYDLFKIFNKCFVINLRETGEGVRRMKVLKKHKILSKYITRFPGIYGKEYNYSKELHKGILTKSWDYGSWLGKNKQMVQMSDGECGCILSHYYLWKKIVDEKIPVTMILEDDAINVHPRFEKNVINFHKSLPKGWDIFLLGFWLNKGNNGEQINKDIYSVDNFVLLHSYLITYEGAKKLLDLTPIDMPLDSWISSKSKYINIYRHTLSRNNKYKPSSLLIRQKRNSKQIVNTNNYIK